MSYLRPGDTRGFANFGWLQSRHSFSFGSWYDPRFMGVSVLRVINDDRVQGGAGFDTHSHRDMEIISYVVQGTMEHRDSLGHVQRMEAGEFQIMSAGTGVSHSEYNASGTDELKFLQIWIHPNQKGLVPGYQQKSFAREEDEEQGRRLIFSHDGRAGSMVIHQDAQIWLLRPQPEQSLKLAGQPSRLQYLHLIKGRATLAGETLSAGDAYCADQGEALELTALEPMEALLFDLPNG